MSSRLQPLLINSLTIQDLKGWEKASKNIRDPLSICFSERFLILEKPKTKSKKAFWSSLNIGDILRVSIVLRESGNRGKTYQSSCTVDNELTDQTYTDYPVNILRYLKRIKYKQLDI